MTTAGRLTNSNEERRAGAQVRRSIVKRDRRACADTARHPWRRRLAASVVACLVMAPMTALAVLTPAGAASPPVTNELHAGSALQPGQSLVSRGSLYRLSMLRDGNLVLYKQNRVTWVSGTAGHTDAVSELERDGVFTITQDGRSLFATPAYANHASARYLFLESNGNIVICDDHANVLWSIDRPPTVQVGDTGANVLALQRRLTTLGYWLGSPDGQFGDSTQQAVWAFQKAAGQSRDGVVGPVTWRALDLGVEPKPRPASGNLIEVNLNSDLLMIMRNGKLWETLNTSTGGGYTYTSDGVTSVAITPQGVFHIYAEINGIDVDSLGTLWRPKFFVGGYAIHGDSSVPPVPVSHGCVRVSNEAIDWIWANNVAPIGTEVWVF